MLDHQISEDTFHHIFRGATKKTYAQFKKDATAELDGTWASPFVSYAWKDRVVEITSYGVSGSVRLDEGADRNMVIAEVIFTGFPATLPYMKNKVVSDIRRMTEQVVESSTLQKDEQHARDQIMAAAKSGLFACINRERSANRSLRRWQVFDDVTRVLVAVAGTGTAFALWAQDASAKIRPFALAFVSLVAVLSTLQAVLKVSDQIKSWSELHGHFVRLRRDFETFIEQMHIKSDFAVGEFQQRLEALDRRHTDGAVMWRSDILSTIDGMLAGKQDAVL